ncbi:hypothetical protein SLA2020_252770 [Shorea laevis]
MSCYTSARGISEKPRLPRQAPPGCRVQTRHSSHLPFLLSGNTRTKMKGFKIPANLMEEKSETAVCTESSSTPKHNVTRFLQSQPKQNDASPPAKVPPNPTAFIRSVADSISSQPLPSYDPDVWGVLTAISNHARKRHKGMNMLLTADEHCIGRNVEDVHFQIESTAVSAYHCTIYRKRVTGDDAENSSNCYAPVFLKDTSTNGTYLNWEKLKKNSPEMKIQHGDIISFSAPPQHELAFAYVYREVHGSTPSTEGAAGKRKADELVSENKRLKGIGIGAPEGPISLDDFWSLQQSNRELRKQKLESEVLTIDTLHNENHATMECNENEIKEMRYKIVRTFFYELNKLHTLLDIRQKEAVDVGRILAEQRHVIEDLNERLSASTQSCAEANEIMKSQKASIAELKTQLYVERDQRREEQERAGADLKAAVERAQIEAQEELKQHSDVALKREREQQEVVNKLEDSVRMSSLQVESLATKLEDTRKKLVNSENKVCQLETQVCEERHASANARKRVEELEHEMKGLRKELESEKAAQEEAWAKVSALELEISAAMQDIDCEKRRLKGARERIMLQETQLRAFYSTTEEISMLYAKQQEQLKAMQRTLEDEDNDENTSIDIDLNVLNGNVCGTLVSEKETTACHRKCVQKAGSTSSPQRIDISSDEASVTEKHDCGIRSQEEGENTQEADFTSGDCLVKVGIGSDLDGNGTTPVHGGGPVGTGHVLETENVGLEGERHIDLKKCGTVGGDRMQLDDETHVHETDEPVQTCRETSHNSQSNGRMEYKKSMEDTEGCAIKTPDLLASEVIGSWACSTAPSVHGDNGSPKSGENDEGVRDSGGLVAESQSTPSSEAAAARGNHEHRALSEMIGIVAPDLRQQFAGATQDFDQQRENQGSTSDSDTEDCVESHDDNVVKTVISISDEEIGPIKEADDGQQNDDPMDEDEEATQEDSVAWH